MTEGSVVVVADAHLYHTPDSPSDKLFHEFLRAIPSFGQHLIINGDLFDFWFEYRAVIPRQVFPTLALLSNLCDRGITITLTGGNHDRWGGAFWQEQMGARFFPNGCDMQVAGFQSRVHHGDGLLEQHVGARVLHWITRRPLTRSVFRAIHPDLGFWGVRKMSRALGESSRSDDVLRAAADAQERYARGILSESGEIELLILSHTHRAALIETKPGQWFLNPGPWMDEHRYAIVTPDGPTLKVFAHDG